MNRFLLLLFLSVTFEYFHVASASLTDNSERRVLVRVLPVCFDSKINEWMVLLGLEQGAKEKFWTDFTGFTDQDDSDKVAARTVKQETVDIVDIDSKTFASIDPFMFKGQTTNGLVYFVQINKVSEHDINSKKSSYPSLLSRKELVTWLSIDAILKASEQKVGGGIVPLAKVSHGTITILRSFWNGTKNRFIAQADDYLKDPGLYQDFLLQQADGLSQLDTFFPIPPAGWRKSTFPDAIFFYEKGQPFYEFSNFPFYPIMIERQIYPTTEHYFQAQKFKGYPDIQECILNQKSPGRAYRIAENEKSKVRQDWSEVRIEVMYAALVAKFVQHKDLARMLLGTGEKVIIEDTSLAPRNKHDDPYWGNGRTFMGQNNLGRLLMYIRHLMQKNPPLFLEESAASNPAAKKSIGRRLRDFLGWY